MANSLAPVVRRKAEVATDEVAIIRFLIREDNSPGEIKRGLQRLCDIVELGFSFPEKDNPRQLLPPLMWNSDTLVRRWAYKAIAYIGRSTHLEQLIVRLEREPDLENQTWAMAATVAISRGMEIEDVCRQAKVEVQPVLMMASHIFSQASWPKPQIPLVNINNATGLELKWSALLEGYGAAPVDLFGTGTSNGSQIRELNSHDIPEVSEYSVWALWKNPLYGISDLGFSWDELNKKPPNVRRWTNRLISKSPDLGAKNRDYLVSLSRDIDPGAREGLALGLKSIYFPGVETDILSWHDLEDDENVLAALRDHMARQSDHAIDYADTIERIFRAHLPGSKTRARLLAEAGGTKLRTHLMTIAFEDSVAGQVADMLPLGPLQTDSRITIIMGNQFNTNGGAITAGILIGGNNNGSISGGNMWNSANQAVGAIPADRQADKDYLAEVIRVVSASEIPADAAQNVAAAVEQAAQTPTQENKNRLLTALQGLATGSTAIVSATENVGKLVELGSKFFG